MNDTVSNRTGEYLKAHAEIETEGSKPSKFDQHWRAFLASLPAEKRGWAETHDARMYAFSWYQWGSMDSTFAEIFRLLK